MWRFQDSFRRFSAHTISSTCVCQRHEIAKLERMSLPGMYTAPTDRSLGHCVPWQTNSTAQQFQKLFRVRRVGDSSVDCQVVDIRTSAVDIFPIISILQSYSVRPPRVRWAVAPYEGTKEPAPTAHTQRAPLGASPAAGGGHLH